MPFISLPTGKVIYISTFEYLFVLQDEDMYEFFQNAIADDAGVPEPDNPFNLSAHQGKIVTEPIEEEILPDKETNL